jgi:hypothetical protein
MKMCCFFVRAKSICKVFRVYLKKEEYLLVFSSAFEILIVSLQQNVRQSYADFIWQFQYLILPLPLKCYSGKIYHGKITDI